MMRTSARTCRRRSWTRARSWPFSRPACPRPTAGSGSAPRSRERSLRRSWPGATSPLPWPCSRPGSSPCPCCSRGRRTRSARSSPRTAASPTCPASAALLEPRYDFDPRACRTRAVRSTAATGSRGRKCNVPFAAEAEWMVVYAAAEGATSAFLVRAGRRASTSGSASGTWGLRALPLYKVELRDCFVPAASAWRARAGSSAS
jgi:alkylation response protein AidB-like acyl-CoA dehydrogenase